MRGLVAVCRKGQAPENQPQPSLLLTQVTQENSQLRAKVRPSG